MDLCGCAKPENGGTLIVMGRAFPQYIGDLDKSGGVPITGTSHPQGQTDRLKSYPPKPEGAPGLPRRTTKATPAATRH